MKIIEGYLNTLYKDDESKDVKELKDELREHLTDCTNEYISQGLDLDKAQIKAIEQFDDEGDLSVEVRSIYIKKIDVRKERLKKLRSIRWKVVNILGIFLGTLFFTAYQTGVFGFVMPAWLKAALIISASVLLILSILIYTTKKAIKQD